MKKIKKKPWQKRGNDRRNSTERPRNRTRSRVDVRERVRVEARKHRVDVRKCRRRPKCVGCKIADAQSNKQYEGYCKACWGKGMKGKSTEDAEDIGKTFEPLDIVQSSPTEVVALL